MKIFISEFWMLRHTALFREMQLWPPCAADADIIFSSCGFFFFLSFSSPNLSRCRLDVYHTSTHDVAFVRI